MTAELIGLLGEPQERLYANGTRSVLITRVHGWVSDKVVQQRFNQIKEFEELLSMRAGQPFSSSFCTSRRTNRKNGLVGPHEEERP